MDSRSTTTCRWHNDSALLQNQQSGVLEKANKEKKKKLQKVDVLSDEQNDKTFVSGGVEKANDDKEDSTIHQNDNMT